MVDPVSIGIAVAALLASKFGEGLAQEASGSAWAATRRIRELLAGRFRGDEDGETAIANLQENPTSDLQANVAARVAAAATADSAFGAELARLVMSARRDPGVDNFVAQAFDHAKQVNVRGDNSGPITM
ncbi:hypothetical protein [Nocardia sp. NPDC050710]|uniref:hypothetical protein n=1 Tax=Nocardia sp. NPDC050710 TaxID=3157220 RepID=UPI0033C92F14